MSLSHRDAVFVVNTAETDCGQPHGAGGLPHGAGCLPHGAGGLPHGAGCLSHGAGCLSHGAGCLPHGAGGLPHGAGLLRFLAILLSETASKRIRQPDRNEALSANAQFIKAPMS